MKKRGMGKMIKRINWIAPLGVMVVSLLIAGCAAATPAATEAPPAATEVATAATTPESQPTETATEAPKPLRVAMVFPGSISDKGFNQTGYDGLMMVKDQLGADTAYSENTPVAEYEQVYRSYADQGYDVIIGHGFEFGDIAKKVAPDYPKVYFIVTNNPDTFADNIASVQPNSFQAAYLAGALAGYMTKTNKLGGIAGFDFPVLIAQMEAFKAGALSVNPKATMTIVYIGSFEDVAKAKEAALTQIGGGADVIYHIADAAGLGVIQAAADKGVYAIGWGKDQNDVAPKAVITSEIVDSAKMIFLEVKDIQDGKFKGEVRNFGFDTGVVGLADYHGLVPADIAAKITDLQNKIVSGDVQVPFTTTKSQ